MVFILLSQCHPVSSDCRSYAVVVPIVPQVRGVVTDVAVSFNQPLKAGDVLFRIDSRPYQYEVDRLEAALVGMNAKVAQLSSKLAAAEATSKLAQSNLLVLFYEYFHGETGIGLRASHQTGWTGLIARTLHLFAGLQN